MSEEMNGQNGSFEEKIDDDAAKESAFAAQENHVMYQNVETGTVINGAPKKPASLGFGIASLVLGIMSLLCFCMCCINIPLGVAAIVFGIIQLVESNNEQMSGVLPSKAAKGMAIAGIVTSVVSFALMGWMYKGISSNEDLYKSLVEGGDYPAYYEQFLDDIYGEGNPYTELFKQIQQDVEI